MNETNRANKKAKFCFETSEDAVTWTIFSGLRRAGQLAATVERGPGGAPGLLFWGSAAAAGRVDAVAANLRSVSIELGEDRRRLTEPDAILIWDELLVFVEAKYRSPNDRHPHYKNFSLYTDGRPDLFSVQPSEVAASGYYELTRNWRIGTDVADRVGVRDFLLINLGGRGLAKSAAAFAATTHQTHKRRFCHRSWADVLEQASPLEPWLANYAKAKQLDRL